MCELEYEDAPDVWSETERTARKPHRCSSCGAAISPGERYLVHFSVFDGSVYSQKACAACRVAREEFSDAHKGMMPMWKAFESTLDDCIAEGDEESEARWKPMLAALRSRRPVPLLA